MIVIGLTGSIGMGKSATAAMLKKLGVPVFEADKAVHEMLGPGGRAVRAVGKAFPPLTYPQIYGFKGGKRFIRRAALGKIVFASDKKRKKLESMLHPLVRAAEKEFIRKQKKRGAQIIALDIPLLFETRAGALVDYIIVVTAPRAVQRARVLARPGMDEKKFRAILKRQLPDREKRKRADYVLQTGFGRVHTMKALKKIIAEIKKNHG